LPEFFLLLDLISHHLKKLPNCKRKQGDVSESDQMLAPKIPHAMSQEFYDDLMLI
jgi:hypothetical protein